MPTKGRASASVALWAAALWLAASSALAQDTWETPYPGVTHLHRVTAEPVSIHAVIADLCTPGMRVRASRYEERGQAVSGFASEVGADVAINGDFFDGAADYDTSGFAIGASEAWPMTSTDPRWALAAFGEGRSDIFAAGAVMAPEPWMTEALGGVPELVVDGVAITSYPDWSFCAARHPRSALGVSADRRTLMLATVDGRSLESAGMTCPELAALMVELGADRAINLDGGGSTTLYLSDRGVANAPSDGTERIVGNHLGLVLDGSTGTDACPGGGPPIPPGGYPRCELEGARPGETRTVDDADPCFSSTGPSYFDGGDHGYTYAVDCGAPGPRACGLSDTSGRWTFHVAEAGSYRVEAHVPTTGAVPEAFSAQAPYRIAHLEGERSATVDQEASRGEWVTLAELSLPVQNNVSIELHDNTGEPYTSGGSDNRVVVFDAVRLVGAPPAVEPDAGAPRDAGGSIPDAGTSDASGEPPPDEDGGCSASGARGRSGDGWLALALMLGLGARLRGRRRSR